MCTQMTTRDVCVQTCPVLLRSLLVELQSVAVYPDVHDYAHVTRADKCVNAQHDYYRRLDGASPHDHAYAVGTTTATFDAPPFTPNNTSSFVGSDHFLSTTLQSMFADDTRDEAVQCENVDDFNHFIDYITQPPTPPCSNTATSKPSPPQRRSHGLFEKRLPRTTRRSCRLDERMTLSATQCSTGTSTQTEIMSSRKKQSKRSTDTARACASKLLGCAWQACAHSSSTSLEQLHAHLDNMHVSADDDGQFACGWTSCSMTFARRYLIVRHLRTHTGHRPYVCTVCARACATPERLRLHMRAAHTGERPYACTLCPRRFATTGQRSRHNSTVHVGFGSVVWRCELVLRCCIIDACNIFGCSQVDCGRTYKTKDALRKHCRRQSHL